MGQRLLIVSVTERSGRVRIPAASWRSSEMTAGWLKRRQNASAISAASRRRVASRTPLAVMLPLRQVPRGVNAMTLARPGASVKSPAAIRRSPILAPTQTMEENREPTQSRALGHAPEQGELDAIVASIVKTVDPERIILFGSGARGTMNDESDLDLLVVKDRCRPRGTTTKILDAAPWGRWPLHVVVVWPESLQIESLARDSAGLAGRWDTVCQGGRRKPRTSRTLTGGCNRPLRDSQQRRRPARRTRRTNALREGRRAVAPALSHAGERGIAGGDRSTAQSLSLPTSTPARSNSVTSSSCRGCPKTTR